MDEEVTPNELRELLDADECVRVVDVRPNNRFAEGCVPGSENVPMSELSGRVDEFDGENRIVFVCRRGRASKRAARLLSAYKGCADARIESLAGGVMAWSRSFDLVVDGEEN